MASPKGSACFVGRITRPPAQAPLRSLTRPSLATFLTLSQRSLRFESPNHWVPTKKAPLREQRGFVR